MPSTLEFSEPTALAAGIEALFVQGKGIFDQCQWIEPTSGHWRLGSQRMALERLMFVQYRYPPLPAASAVRLTRPRANADGIGLSRSGYETLNVENW